jgi:hypothetical protein
MSTMADDESRCLEIAQRLLIAATERRGLDTITMVERGDGADRKIDTAVHPCYDRRRLVTQRNQMWNQKKST